MKNGLDSMVKFSLHFPHTYAQSECDKVFEGILKERESKKSGYYDLPFETNALQQAKAYIKDNGQFLDSLSYLVIIGIGGSSLGLKAIDGMLEHLPHRNALKLVFLEHTDPLHITKALQNVALHNALFIVISKSGTTIETSSLLKYVLKLYNILESRESKKHLLVITDKASPLESWAKSVEVKHFEIMPKVEGTCSLGCSNDTKVF